MERVDARESFDGFTASLRTLLRPNEAFSCHLSAEESEFVRFNHARIRQAGSVRQAHVTLDWMEGRRHAAATLTLSGDPAADRERAATAVAELREWRRHLPEDPHLLLPDEVWSSETVAENRLPDAGEAIDEILAHAAGLDLVGLFASGPVHRGFADSRGQRNWHTVHAFHFDWSVHLEADRAVKSALAGTAWDRAALERRLRASADAIEALRRPPCPVSPGAYRVFLSPEAVFEILGILGWGGFGLRAHRTRSSPLLRIVEAGARLHPAVSLVERTGASLAPPFQEAGFRRPEAVTLIAGGEYRDCLVSPRSAAEYGVPCNGASAAESPESLEMAAGGLPAAESLAALGDGLHVSNLHYLNYSDRPACRLTGVTRFASFVVRGGEIAGPLGVMRFDDTLYRIFGRNLLALTAERERIIDSGTYDGRSTRGALVPGALVDDFRFAS